MRRLKQLWELYGRGEAIWGFITSDLVKPYIWPILSGALTMLSALITPIPLPYLITAAFVTAAALSIVLVRIDDWWSRANPSGKLVFEQPIFGMDIHIDGDIHKIERIQIGVFLKNSANYPITYDVEKITSNFAGRICSSKPSVRRDFEISPSSTATYRDAPIILDFDLEKKIYDGELEFKIAYYRNPKRKFYIDRKINIQCNSVPDQRQMAFTWVYA